MCLNSLESRVALSAWNTKIQVYVDSLSINRKEVCALSGSRRNVILMGTLSRSNNFSFFKPLPQSPREVKIGKWFQFIISELFQIPWEGGGPGWKLDTHFPVLINMPWEPWALLQETSALSCQAYLGHRKCRPRWWVAFRELAQWNGKSTGLAGDLDSGYLHQGVCPGASGFNSLRPIRQEWKKHNPQLTLPSSASAKV